MCACRHGTHTHAQGQAFTTTFYFPLDLVRQLHRRQLPVHGPVTSLRVPGQGRFRQLQGATSTTIRKSVLHATCRPRGPATAGFAGSTVSLPPRCALRSPLPRLFSLPLPPSSPPPPPPTATTTSCREISVTGVATSRLQNPDVPEADASTAQRQSCDAIKHKTKSRSAPWVTTRFVVVVTQFP